LFQINCTKLDEKAATSSINVNILVHILNKYILFNISKFYSERIQKHFFYPDSGERNETKTACYITAPKTEECQ